MIEINLLRAQRRSKLGGLFARLPRPVLIGAAAALAVGAFVIIILSAGAKKLTAEEEALFGAVDSIVSDIRQGRFTVRKPAGPEPPAALQPQEKRSYERIFIKNAFDALNACLRKGVGLKTVALDNLGNFLISGTAASDKAAAAFRADIEKQGAVQRAGEVAIARRFGKSKIRFALGGELGHSVPEQDPAWETVPENPQIVLDGILAAGRESGIDKIGKVSWGASEDAGAWKKHVLSLQAVSSYAGLIKWIRRVYGQSLPIGYSQINLITAGSQKILTSVQYYVYAKN